MEMAAWVAVAGRLEVGPDTTKGHFGGGGVCEKKRKTKSACTGMAGDQAPGDNGIGFGSALGIGTGMTGD